MAWTELIERIFQTLCAEWGLPVSEAVREATCREALAVADLFSGPDADGFYRLRVRAEPQLSDPPPSGLGSVQPPTPDGPDCD